MSVPQAAVRTLLDRATPERDFQTTLIGEAERWGWLCYFVPDSRRSPSGWPDLALCHPTWHRFLIVELKASAGRLRSAQRIWLDALRAAGVDARVWRPGNMAEAIGVLSNGRAVLT